MTLIFQLCHLRPETIREANLKETSLYALGERCGLPDSRAFVRRFIAWEREVGHG